MKLQKLEVAVKTGKVSQLVLGGLLSALLSCASASAQVLKGSTEQAKAVTNEDVLQMVHQGASEQAIIAAIRANPTNFDLSLNKMLALHREGVSTHILNAMSIARMRERKAGGETNADELSPQPYPPKSKTDGTLLNSGAQQTMLGTQANSPSGDGGKSALVPLVQRTAAAGTNNQGATEMSPTAVERNASLGDGNVQASTTGMSTTQKPALNGTGKAAITSNQAAATVPAMMQKTSAGTIGAGQTMSAQGNASSSTILTQSARTVALVPQAATASSAPRTTNLAAIEGMPSEVNLQVAEECAKDPTRRILSVRSSATGSAAARPVYTQRMTAQPLIFRPGPQYTIWGCSLSSLNDQNGGLVFLGPGPVYGGPVLGGLGGLSDPWTWFLLGLNIDSWTDNAIVVSVPSDPDDLEWLRTNGYAASDGQDIKLWVQSAVTDRVITMDGFGFSTYAQ